MRRRKGPDSRGWGSEGRFEHIYGLRESCRGNDWKIQGESERIERKSPGESLEERFALALKRKNLSGGWARVGTTQYFFIRQERR